MRRRLKRMALTPSIFVELAKHGSTGVDVVKHRLPKDAEYVYATFDPQNGQVWVFIESASFDEVSDGERVPELPAPVFSDRLVTTHQPF